MAFPFKTVLSTTTGRIGVFANAWESLCCLVKSRLMSDISPMVASSRIMKRRFVMVVLLGVRIGH